MDAIIKASVVAKVIPSAEAIATEFTKQHREQQIQQNRAGLIRERWMDHNNKVDMVRDAGVAYETYKEGDKLIICPLCAEIEDSIRGKVGTILT